MSNTNPSSPPQFGDWLGKVLGRAKAAAECGPKPMLKGRVRHAKDQS